MAQTTAAWNPGESPSAGGLRLVFLLHLVAAQPKVISRQTASFQSQELQPSSQQHLQTLEEDLDPFTFTPALSLCWAPNGVRLGVSGKKGKELITLRMLLKQIITFMSRCKIFHSRLGDSFFFGHGPSLREWGCCLPLPRLLA